MADFQIKKGDTSPAILSRLTADGDAVDLSASEINDVRFLMRRGETTVVDDNTNGNVSVTDPGNGTVRYDWQSEDTDTSGYNFWAEWEVTFADGSVETYPNDDYISVCILDDLG